MNRRSLQRIYSLPNISQSNFYATGHTFRSPLALEFRTRQAKSLLRVLAAIAGGAAEAGLKRRKPA